MMQPECRQKSVTKIPSCKMPPAPPGELSAFGQDVGDGNQGGINPYRWHSSPKVGTEGLEELRAV